MFPSERTAVQADHDVSSKSNTIGIESLTMPADDGFGFDDQESGTPTRPNSGQPNPQAAIAAIEDEPLWLLVSLQHGQLMAQCDDLGEHYGLAPRAHEKGIQQH